MPTMLLSTLEDLNKTFKRRPVTKTGQAGVTRRGIVRSVILESGDGPTAPGTVVFRRIVYVIETSDGYIDTWENPCFAISDRSSLIGDVQAGWLTVERFAEIVGIPLAIAENLIEVYRDRPTVEQT